MKQYAVEDYKGLWVVTESCPCGSHVLATCPDEDKARAVAEAMTLLASQREGPTTPCQP